jgi:hypothetical protein
MASEPELQSWHKESPYGPVAQELGLSAVSTVDALTDEPKWRGGTQRHWLPSDSRSFERTLDFARLASDAQGHLDVFTTDDSPEDMDGGTIATNLDMLHTSLPFSEGERHWLIYTMFIASGWIPHARHAHTAVGKVRQRTSGTPDAGHFRPVRGTDLLDAWWAWRRDVFEFENSGMIDYAASALRGIASILVPNMPQVASYESMRSASIQAARDKRRAGREVYGSTGATEPSHIVPSITEFPGDSDTEDADE